jgi:CO dehydrogenase maturation factor
MKICICGKGGCGKSTIVSLLSYSFRRLGKKVFVLDSDESNNNLYWMLGFDQPPKDLMDLAGGKIVVKQKMRAGFSNGKEEAAMSNCVKGISDLSSIPAEYICSENNLSLLVTGKIHHAMEGCACSMGSVTRQFLKNIVLKSDEILLVDTEAGVEHFGRGVEAGADCVIGVAEPSLESISLAKTIHEMTLRSGSVFKGVIINKYNSSSQQEQIEKRLASEGIPVIGNLAFSIDLQDACFVGKSVANFDEVNKFDHLAKQLLNGITGVHGNESNS